MSCKAILDLLAFALRSAKSPVSVRSIHSSLRDVGLMQHFWVLAAWRSQRTVVLNPWGMGNEIISGAGQ